MATEERVAGEGGYGGEENGEGEAEEDVVELVWRQPRVFPLHSSLNRYIELSSVYFLAFFHFCFVFSVLNFSRFF